MILLPSKSTLFPYNDALPISIDDYNIHFGYLLDFLGKDISNIKFNKYLFQSYIAYILDRKSTRLNSSHVRISYAVFCLKKKKKKNIYDSHKQSHWQHAAKSTP